MADEKTELSGAALESQHPTSLSNPDVLTFSNSSHVVEISYPEGGFAAWLVVFGCFTTTMASFGFMNGIGAIAAQLHAGRLSGHDEGQIGWIFGIYVWLCFFGGVIIGPIFDLYGPRVLMMSGCIGMAAAFVLTSFCQKYWQFLLVLGVMMGITHSMLFTPSVTTIGHYFLKKRGLATGIAITGGSIGGIVFTLLLRHLHEKLGFAWSIRIVGLISFILSALGVVFIKGRNFEALSSGKAENSERPQFSWKLVARNIDIFAFKDITFSLTTIGIFLIEWALFSPITYLTTYALAMESFSPDLAYYLIAIVNAGSFFGRWIPGIVADRVGRFNTMIWTVGICVFASFALWLPSWYARDADNGKEITKGLLIAFALIYGFGSGSGISLTPVCVGQISETKDYGKKYGTCYSVVSFGTLTGIPIAGELIARGRGDFSGLIIFTGVSYIAAMAFFAAARVVGGGWKWTKF